MYYMGVDLGKKKSQIAVLDSNGELYTEGKILNHKHTIERFVKQLRGPATMVCETGNKSFWLADIMEDCGVNIKKNTIPLFFMFLSFLPCQLLKLSQIIVAKVV